MKIDLVYLGVDVNDPRYVERNKKFIKKINFQLYRYRQVDELKYSLRSVNKFLPWINNIYIITDNQKPTGLNISHPKIHIIDHRDILPKDVKHCFNSCALEACLSNINELSEYFLYANDDMFVNKQLTENYFFDKKNRPIFKTMNLPYASNNLHNLIIHNCNVAVFNKYSKYVFRVPSHNITPYIKSEFTKIVNDSKFSVNFNATKRNMGRSVFDVSRFLIHNVMYKNKTAKFKKTHFKDELYCTARNLSLVKLLKPNLFCVNDSTGIKSRHTKKLNIGLEKKFPEKAPGEV